MSVVVVSTKITSLGDLGTCKQADLSELAKENWPQCALCHFVQATSITNSEFLPIYVDHTYLLGHVLTAHAHY